MDISADSSLGRDLESLITGEVFTDPVTREIYATAACIYRVLPRAVARPGNEEEVAAIIEYAADRGIPVTARGAGTAVAGQTVGSGIVIDLKAHMNEVLSIEADEKEAVVRPGVVLGDLNRELSKHGLFFPPDPSSGDYATIGGMIANNSSGARSLKYGDTRRWTARLKVVLSDGSISWMDKKPALPRAMTNSPVLENRIYAGLPLLLEKYSAEIESSRPRTKNSSGYHVWDLAEGREVDPVPLLAGSEGTLAVAVKAVLRLEELPRGRAAALVSFPSMDAAVEAVQEVLTCGPSALEIMDGLFVSMVREHRPELRDILPERAEAVLLIEFEGESEDDASRRLSRALDGSASAWVLRAETEEQARALWSVRKAASPILYRLPGKRLTRFIEDVVVPRERLGEGIAKIKSILKSHGTEAPVLGHAGSGNLHVNPRLDLCDSADRERMQGIAEDVYTAVIEMGGSISGEHGDGMLRAAYVPRQFPGLAPLLGEIKDLFDPKGILNPGKIVSSIEIMPAEPLRFAQGPPLKEAYPELTSPPLLEMLMRCHGCGLCRTYCPVVSALGEEAAMPRSKVSLLRALVQGDLEMDSPEVHQALERALSLCTSCGTCAHMCPTGIEPERLIRAFFADHYGRAGRPLREALFGRADRVLRAGSLAPGLASALMKNPASRSIMGVLGINKAAPLVAPAGRSDPEAAKQERAAGRVVFYRGCLGSYADQEGESAAALELLHRLGFETVSPRLPCCGETRLASSDLAGARKMARDLARRLNRYLEQGYKVVTACQTCAVNLKREYAGLAGDEAGRLPEESFELLEFIDAKADLSGAGFEEGGPSTVIYFRSCQQRALGRVDHAGRVLARIPGLELVKVEGECCGLAGVYGMRSENAEVSRALSAVLERRFRETGAGRVVCACPMCRLAIRALGYEPVSPAALLVERLDPLFKPACAREGIIAE